MPDVSYAGPERRRIERTKPAPVRVIGRARLHARLGIYPSFSLGTWYPVIDRNPDILLAIEGGAARPGYIWIQGPARAQHVLAVHFEVELEGT